MSENQPEEKLEDIVQFVAEPDELLRILYRDERVMAMCHNDIEHKTFEKGAQQWTYAVMRAVYRKFGTLPSQAKLLRVLHDHIYIKKKMSPELEDEYKKYINNLTGPIKHEAMTKDEISRFVKYHAYRRANGFFTEVMATGDVDKLDKLDEVLKQCAQAGSINDFKVFDLFEDVENLMESIKRGEEQARYYCGTSVPEVNRMLYGGGIGPGELGIVVAAYNRGKSFFLCDTALETLQEGRNVLYVTLEMSARKVAIRMIGSISGLNTDNIRPERYDDEIFAKALKRIMQRKKIGGKLKIFQYPTESLTVPQLKADIQNYKDATGFVPDLIVVDYGNIMRSEMGAEQGTSQSVGSIFTGLRSIAGQLDVPVWTASQLNRGGAKKERAGSNDLAESIKVAWIADVLLVLNQGEQEIDDKIVRILIDKNRDGDKDIEFKIRTGFPWGRFYQGMVSDNAEEELEIQDRIRPYDDEDSMRKPITWLEGSDYLLHRGGEIAF